MTNEQKMMDALNLLNKNGWFGPMRPFNKETLDACAVMREALAQQPDVVELTDAELTEVWVRSRMIFTLTDSFFIDLANKVLPGWSRKDNDLAYITFGRAVAEAAVQAAREGQEPLSCRRCNGSGVVRLTQSAECYGVSTCPQCRGFKRDHPPAAPVPEGYVLVPKVATREIEDTIARSRNLKAAEIWEDALAASQK